MGTLLFRDPTPIYNSRNSKSLMGTQSALLTETSTTVEIQRASWAYEITIMPLTSTTVEIQRASWAGVQTRKTEYLQQ